MSPDGMSTYLVNISSEVHGPMQYLKPVSLDKNIANNWA